MKKRPTLYSFCLMVTVENSVLGMLYTIIVSGIVSFSARDNDLSTRFDLDEYVG
jgi:hypothetical protein